MPTILRHYGVSDTVEQVTATSAWLLARMVELFRQDLPVQPGAAALLAALRRAAVPVALVPSSYRALVDGVLDTGLGPFAFTLAGDEVLHGKPHPEPYLTAAAALGVSPGDCVVLEDSPAGVASVEAAGCAVVAVPSVAGLALEPAPRRLVAGSLTEVDLAALRALLA